MFDLQLPFEINLGDGSKISVEPFEGRFFGYKKGRAIQVTTLTPIGDEDGDGDERYTANLSAYFREDEAKVAIAYAYLRADCYQNISMFTTPAIERMAPNLDDVFERDGW